MPCPAPHLPVEHRHTVAPRGDDVPDTCVYRCASRFAVETRHQQVVVVGVDVAHQGDDGQDRVGVQRPTPAPRPTRPLLRVAARSRGSGRPDNRGSAPDRGRELTPEPRVVVGFGRRQALPFGPVPQCQKALLSIRPIDRLLCPQLLEVHGAAPCRQESPVASSCNAFGLHADGVFARRHSIRRGTFPWPQ